MKSDIGTGSVSKSERIGTSLKLKRIMYNNYVSVKHKRFIFKQIMSNDKNVLGENMLFRLEMVPCLNRHACTSYM